MADDIARLGYEIDSTQARTAAGDLDKMSVAAGKAAGTADKLKISNNGISTTYKAAALSAKQLATTNKLLQANFTSTGRAAQVMGQQVKASTAHTTNLMFQFQDIGMMLAAGQNPLMLAMQQGTQVSGVFKQMKDSGQSAFAGIRGGLLSMVSPMALVTIGSIAGVAALTQWAASALSAGDEAGDFSDIMDELSASIAEYKKYSSDASKTTFDLAGRFGSLSDDASSLSKALATIGRIEAIRAADNAIEKLTERFGGLSRTQLAYSNGVVREIEKTFYELRDELSLTDVQAATVIKSLEGLADATTMEDKVVAANSLNEAFIRVFGSVEAVPDALLDIQKEALLLGVSVAEIEGATNKVAQASIMVYQSYQQSRIESDKAAISANTLLRELQSQAEMQGIIAMFGEDSRQATEARLLAERGVFQELLASKEISESLKAEMTLAWDAANGIASADMEGNITLASNAASTLARNLSLAARGQQMLNAAVNNPDFYDPRNESGLAGDTDPNRYDVPLGLPGVDMPPNPTSGRKKRSGGGGASTVQDDMARRYEALTEGFKSESALAMTNYAKDLETLKWALEQKRLTQSEYKVAQDILRIETWGTGFEQQQLQYQLEQDALAAALEKKYITEKEYQQRIAAIKTAERNVTLMQTAGLFGSLQQLAQSGGAKLAKTAALFGGIQATIASYVAATKAMNETPGDLTVRIGAYASVLATGLGAVAAIKSAGGSGGGGTSSAAPASASGTTQQAQPERRVMVSLDGPDWVKGIIEPIMTQIYEQTGDGTKVIFSK